MSIQYIEFASVDNIEIHGDEEGHHIINFIDAGEDLDLDLDLDFI